mmetsp:Transcript_17257/g.56469  ORF Transcript_17257/g.56469 Transcript_17257/m.56469 type:complete len:341 (-) Transcript_17257:828-1850(-)
MALASVSSSSPSFGGGGAELPISAASCASRARSTRRLSLASITISALRFSSSTASRSSPRRGSLKPTAFTADVASLMRACACAYFSSASARHPSRSLKNATAAAALLRACSSVEGAPDSSRMSFAWCLIVSFLRDSRPVRSDFHRPRKEFCCSAPMSIARCLLKHLRSYCLTFSSLSRLTFSLRSNFWASSASSCSSSRCALLTTFSIAWIWTWFKPQRERSSADSTTSLMPCSDSRKCGSLALSVVMRKVFDFTSRSLSFSAPPSSTSIKCRSRSLSFDLRALMSFFMRRIKAGSPPPPPSSPPSLSASADTSSSDFLLMCGLNVAGSSVENCFASIAL